MRTKVLVMFAVMLGSVTGRVMAQYDPCDIPPGIYRTQTQGGWGQACHGQNAGCLRDEHFDEAFPAGLVVGGTFGIHLTSSGAVVNFLPAGGEPGMLTSNYVDPLSTEAGVFAGQVVALAISLGFAEVSVPGFGDLGNLVVPTGFHEPWGPFAGYTVSEVFALANVVLGGDAAALPAGISVSDLNDVVDAVNNDFDDGEQSNGYLVEEECDEILPVHLTAEPTLTPSDGRLTLCFFVADEHDVTRYEIVRNGARVVDLTVANGSYAYEDRNVMNDRRYEYGIWAVELGQRKALSYDGRSLWAGVPSAGNGIKTQYGLHQNHPNPFNRQTTIQYDMAMDGRVRLRVFDITGRFTTTLTDEYNSAGSHTVVFDGSALPSGIYLIAMKMEGFHATMKVVLAK